MGCKAITEGKAHGPIHDIRPRGRPRRRIVFCYGTVDQPGRNPQAPSTGTSSNMSGTSKSSITTEAQARSRLEAEGYSDIQDLKKDRDGWVGKAMKNGKRVAVDVDKDGDIDVK